VNATAEPTTEALRDCLLRLRERAACDGRSRDVNDIDAALAGDVDGQVRGLIGGATLTPAEFDLVRFFFTYRRDNGVSPTLQEIADAQRVTKVTIFERVNNLKRKGVLTDNGTRHKCRAMSIVGM
jgi:hypothetical protein